MEVSEKDRDVVGWNDKMPANEVELRKEDEEEKRQNSNNTERKRTK